MSKRMKKTQTGAREPAVEIESIFSRLVFSRPKLAYRWVCRDVYLHYWVCNCWLASRLMLDICFVETAAFVYLLILCVKLAGVKTWKNVGVMTSGGALGLNKRGPNCSIRS